MASVLVVDDEFGITEVLDALLTDSGHQVHRAINGRQGLDVVQQHIPDIILLDMMMPLLDGPGMLRALRNDPRTQKVPVVLMSGLPREKVEEMTTGLEFQKLLHKPFRADEVLDTIAAICPDPAR